MSNQLPPVNGEIVDTLTGILKSLTRAHGINTVLTAYARWKASMEKEEEDSAVVEAKTEEEDDDDDESGSIMTLSSDDEEEEMEEDACSLSSDDDGEEEGEEEEAEEVLSRCESSVTRKRGRDCVPSALCSQLVVANKIPQVKRK